MTPTLDVSVVLQQAWRKSLLEQGFKQTFQLCCAFSEFNVTILDQVKPKVIAQCRSHAVLSLCMCPPGIQVTASVAPVAMPC